jgi:hypothetical protein
MVMKTAILNELRTAIEEWARLHNIETSRIEVKYSGISSHIHIDVVARRGFENWWWAERDRSLIDFIFSKVKQNGDFFISRLETMTEAEYEKYESIEV